VCVCVCVCECVCSCGQCMSATLQGTSICLNRCDTALTAGCVKRCNRVTPIAPPPSPHHHPTGFTFSGHLARPPRLAHGSTAGEEGGEEDEDEPKRKLLLPSTPQTRVLLKIRADAGASSVCFLPPRPPKKIWDCLTSLMSPVCCFWTPPSLPPSLLSTHFPYMCEYTHITTQTLADRRVRVGGGGEPCVPIREKAHTHTYSALLHTDGSPGDRAPFQPSGAALTHGCRS